MTNCQECDRLRDENEQLRGQLRAAEAAREEAEIVAAQKERSNRYHRAEVVVLSRELIRRTGSVPDYDELVRQHRDRERTETDRPQLQRPVDTAQEATHGSR